MAFLTETPLSSAASRPHRLPRDSARHRVKLGPALEWKALGSNTLTASADLLPPPRGLDYVLIHTHTLQSYSGVAEYLSSAWCQIKGLEAALFGLPGVFITAQ